MDLDGIISAYLAKKLFEKMNYKVVFEKPLDYSPESRKSWEKYKFKTPFIIVDFIYHKKAFAWFDHHASNEAKVSDNTKYHYFNKECNSCSSVIQKFAKQQKICLGRTFRLIKQTNIVDSAKYVMNKIKPMETIIPKKDFMKVAKALDVVSDEMSVSELSRKILKDLSSNTLKEFFDSLFDARLERIAKQDYIKKILEKNKTETEKKLKEFPNYSKKDGLIVIYDSTKIEFDRFMPALFYPETIVWVGLLKVNNKLSLRVGRNPWFSEDEYIKYFGTMDKPKIHIGNLLKKVSKDAGGHQYVGGVQFSTEKEARKGMEKIVKLLKEKLES